MTKRKPDGGLPPLDSFFVDGGEIFRPYSVSGNVKERRHAQGNWPSFIHIPLPSHKTAEDEEPCEDFTNLCRFAANAAEQARLHLSTETSPEVSAGKLRPELREYRLQPAGDATSSPHLGSWAHVSLARPFALRKHEIEPFIRVLGTSVSQVPSFEVGVGATWNALGDEEGGGRSFLVLDIVKGRSELTALLRACDDTLVRFGRPKYYEPPYLHVSVGEINADLEHPAVDHLLSCCLPSRPEASKTTGAAFQAAAQADSIERTDFVASTNDCIAVYNFGDHEDDDVAYFNVSAIEIKAGNRRFRLGLRES